MQAKQIEVQIYVYCYDIVGKNYFYRNEWVAFFFWGISEEISFQSDCCIPHFVRELKGRISGTWTLLSLKAHSCYCTKKKRLLDKSCHEQKHAWLTHQVTSAAIQSWSQLLIVCLFASSFHDVSVFRQSGPYGLYESRWWSKCLFFPIALAC